jgi:hypothetical protein
MWSLRIHAPVVLLLLLLSLGGPVTMQKPSPIDQAGLPTSCMWVALSAEHLLNRRLGAIDLKGGDLREVFEHILRDQGVPVSYIEAEEHSPITLHIANPTVRELLDALAFQTRSRYAFLRQHLVFYPEVSPYSAPMIDMAWPLQSRSDAADRLVGELKKMKSEFAGLEPPLFMGQMQHFLFADTVVLSKPERVLDALVQLLGNRPSACFSIKHRRFTGLPVAEGGSYLDLFYVRVVERLEVKPLLRTVHVGDVVPLAVRADFVGGGTQDLTSKACGTTYLASNPETAAIDEGGVMRALAPGNVVIVARNEMETIALPLTVLSAGNPGPGAPNSERQNTVHMEHR